MTTERRKLKKRGAEDEKDSKRIDDSRGSV